jgi:hypothetical protein
MNLGAENRQCVNRACFTARRKTIQRRTTDHHGVRAERNRFHDIAAASEAAIDNDAQSITDGLRNIGQYFDG